jgi:hypothetical protein
MVLHRMPDFRGESGSVCQSGAMTDTSPSGQTPHPPRPDLHTSWPRDPAAFGDTSSCPRCFARLSSPLCGNCGLDLSVPLAAQLLQASERLVEAEGERQRILVQMWSEQQARDAARAQPQPATAPFPAVAAPPAPPAPVQAGPPHPGLPEYPQPASGKPRRSGVQIFLLVTGIVLLAIFAIVFLTVAYLFADIEVRVLMTGAASLLVLGVAWFLAKRRLPGTAEGVGIVGSLVLIIDLLILRGNELFGSGGVDGALFSGVSLLFVAALLVGVRVLTRLRFASIAVTVLTPLGAFLTAFGLLQRTDAALAWLVGLAVASSVTLVVPLAFGLRAERIVLLATGFGYGSAALIPAGLLFDAVAWAPALTYFVVAALWGAQALVAHRLTPRFWFGYASALLGLAVALAPVISILRTKDYGLEFWIAPAAAAVLFAVACFVTTRSPRLVAATSEIAGYTIAAVAALALLPTLALGALSYLVLLGYGFSGWGLGANERFIRVPSEFGWAIFLAPTIAAVCLVFALLALRRLARSAAIPVSLFAAALIATAAQASSPLLALIAFAIVAVCALAVFFVPPLRSRPAIAVPSLVTVALSGLALYLLGWSSQPLWPAAMAAFIALWVGSRLAVRRSDRYRTLAIWLVTGGGIVLTLIAVGWVSRWLSRSSLVPREPAPLDDAFWPAVAAALLLIMAAAFLIRREHHAPDARVAAIVSLAWIAGCSVPLLLSRESLLDRDVALLIVFGLVVTAAVVWQLVPAAGRRPERIVAAAYGPLALAVVAVVCARLVDPEGPDQTALWLAVPVAAIVAASAGVALLRTPASRFARYGWDAAVAALVLFVVVSSAAPNHRLSWLALVLVAIVPLLLASGEGNPLTTRAWRRHLAWAALPLAAAGLWQYLASSRTAAVEPYTLPIAGALILVGVLIAIVRPKAVTTTAGRTALVASGAAIAVVPSALVSGADGPARAIVLLVVGAALVMLSLVGPARMRGIDLRATSLGAGIVALAVPGLLRSFGALARPGAAGIDLELWLLPALAALAAVAGVWSTRGYRPASVTRLAVPAAVVLLSIPELWAVGTGERAALRALLVVAVLAALHIGTVWHPRSPLGTATEYTSLSLAVLVGIVGLASGYTSPLELVSVPLAIALIVAGLIRLDRNPAARTWPQLGPGFAVLLIPSLLPDFAHTELWRVVALGVVALATVVLSIALRWQAPLLIAGIVLIVHAVAQLWPWIADVYSVLPWWLWLGIGGVLLVAVAARYEHRVRNLRSIAGTIASLR